MALIFNGTTIPTNVANALKYNGTNITKVVFNSTTVWTQSLFQAKWSGSSSSNNLYGYHFALDTSGNLFRYKTIHYTGAWITTNMNGTFTGNSLSYYMGFITNGNLLRLKDYNKPTSWCTYNVANQSWTGDSRGAYDFNDPYSPPIPEYLETSGGLIRARREYHSAGAWISLT